MKSYELYLTFGKDGPPRYYVRIFEQPAYRYLIAAVYHWYDMYIFKVPAFKAFERWHSKRYCKDFTYLPITARQDIKCHFLGERDKKILKDFEVDSTTYDMIGGQVLTET